MSRTTHGRQGFKVRIPHAKREALRRLRARLRAKPRRTA